MSKYITRAGRSASLMLATTLVFGLIAAQESDTARAVTRTQAVAAVPTVAVSAAATPKPKRVRALRWAVQKANGPRDRYRWGGNGLTYWDCSGLIVRAYKSVGISLPRTTQEMVKSSRLQPISRSNALSHSGTIAFSGGRWVKVKGKRVYRNPTHVELVSSRTYMFGAHNSSLPGPEQVGYRKWYSPNKWVFFRVVGAG